MHSGHNIRIRRDEHRPREHRHKRIPGKCKRRRITGTVKEPSDPGRHGLSQLSFEEQGEPGACNPARDKLDSKARGDVHLIHLSPDKDHGQPDPTGDRHSPKKSVRNIHNS